MRGLAHLMFALCKGWRPGSLGHLYPVYCQKPDLDGTTTTGECFLVLVTMNFAIPIVAILFCSSLRDLFENIVVTLIPVCVLTRAFGDEVSATMSRSTINFYQMPLSISAVPSTKFSTTGWTTSTQIWACSSSIHTIRERLCLWGQFLFCCSWHLHWFKTLNATFSRLQIYSGIKFGPVPVCIRHVVWCTAVFGWPPPTRPLYVGFVN